MAEFAKITDKQEYLTILGDGDGKSDALIRLGAKDKPDILVPNLNFSKWSDEAFVNLNPRQILPTISSSTSFNDGVAEVDVGDVKIKSWVLNDGVLEYAFMFASKPSISQIEFEITQSDNIRWLYQGTLEDEWKRNSMGMNLEEFLAAHNRHENIVGSYHLQFDKTGNNYKTGTFGHIFAWECIDAKGNKARCGNLVKDGNTLIIPLPVEWLKTANYPVTAMGMGDTFGVTSIAGTTEGSYGGKVGCLFTCPTAGTLVNLNWYSHTARADTNYYNLILFEDSDHYYDDRISATFQALPADDWITKAVSAEIANADYVITLWPSAGVSGVNYNYVADGSNPMRYTTGITAVYEPWTGTVYGRLISCYANYEASGSTFIPRREIGAGVGRGIWR